MPIIFWWFDKILTLEGKRSQAVLDGTLYKIWPISTESAMDL